MTGGCIRASGGAAGFGGCVSVWLAMVAEATFPARNLLAEVLGHDLLAADARARVYIGFEGLDLARAPHGEIIQHRWQRRLRVGRRRLQLQKQVADASPVFEPARIAPCQD